MSGHRGSHAAPESATTRPGLTPDLSPASLSPGTKPSTSSSSSTTGLRPYAAMVLRQDVRNFMPWVILISLLSVTSVLAYIWIFPDQASRAQLSATLSGNPALSIIFGPPGDLSTTEAFNTWRALALGGFFGSLMATFIVVRYTRADEDTGQAELFASGVMGRQTRLAAAVLVAAVASVLLGIVSFLLTIAFGAGAFDTMLLSATFTANALMAGGIAAIAVQIGADARAAQTMSVALLGGWFVLRGYLDASAAPEWTTWLTPLGWMQAVKPAGDYTLWPFALAAVFTAATLAVAFGLNCRRDFGSALIQPRPGPATAEHRGGIFGFTFQLNLASAAAWLAGFVVLGLVFGYLSSSVRDLFATDPNIGKILASGATDTSQLMSGFIGMILKMVGIIAAVAGVQIIMRMAAEETAMRADPLLASRLTRTKYLASYLLVSFGTALVAMLIATSIIAFVGSALDQDLRVPDILSQGLVTIPAVWTVIALSFAVVGAHPQRKIVGWLGLVAVFALTIFGPMFNLWHWILGISPFHHVPVVTAVTINWGGWLVTNLVILVLLAVSFIGFNRRDLL